MAVFSLLKNSLTQHNVCVCHLLSCHPKEGCFSVMVEVILDGVVEVVCWFVKRFVILWN